VLLNIAKGTLNLG